MLIKQLIENKKNNIETIHPNGTVLEAAELMQSKKIGFLVVMENKKPVGVLSERDIVYKAVTSHQSIEVMLVKEIMTKNMIWVREDAELKKAFQVMKKNYIRHLPVKDENETPVCVISERDITSFLYQKIQGQ